MKCASCISAGWLALACQGSGASRPAAVETGVVSSVAVLASKSPSPPAPERPAVEEPASPSAPVWPPSPPGIRNDFCTEHLQALDDSSCYVLPDAPTDELLIYLHGILPPSKTSAVKTNFQAVVAKASRRAGAAALIPRGRRGLAPRGQDDWWGWPTSAAARQRFSAELVTEFAGKRRQLEELTGRQFTRVYVAGSSSGAYFAVGLALDGTLSADGFGALSGGADIPSAGLSGLSPRPVYIGYGTHDTVGDSARALAQRLRRAGWPVEIKAHPGGHGAKEIYLDEAFVFWRAYATR